METTEAAAVNGRPKRRDLSDERHGKRIDLPGGGWVRLRARGNIEGARKSRDLQAAYRAEHGLAIDDKIPSLDWQELLIRSMVGTTLVSWGDFSDGETDLEVNEANGVFLLTDAGAARNEILDALDALDALNKRNVEVAEGNLPPASDGSSATDPTPAS